MQAYLSEAKEAIVIGLDEDACADGIAIVTAPVEPAGDISIDALTRLSSVEVCARARIVVRYV